MSVAPHLILQLLRQETGFPDAAARSNTNEVTLRDAVKTFVTTGMAAVEPGWERPVLAMIERRPGMYLGSENARDLEVYLAGYAACRHDLGLDGRERLLTEFHRWLSGRSEVTNHVAWWDIVQHVDPSDRSIHTFFRLFDEFLATRAEETPRSSADESTGATTDVGALILQLLRGEKDFAAAAARSNLSEDELRATMQIFITAGTAALEASASGWEIPALAMIRRQPSMSLGPQTVRALEIYLAGYAACRYDLGLDGREQLLKEFYPWLAGRSEVTNHIAWWDIVQQVDPSDRNIQTFFRLFDEFLASRAEERRGTSAAE